MSDRAGVPSKEALARLGAWPRQLLAMLPTQLVAADQLTRSLGASARPIYLKIDADTGLGLGGNKVRKLEFELPPSDSRG